MMSQKANFQPVVGYVGICHSGYWVGCWHKEGPPQPKWQLYQDGATETTEQMSFQIKWPVSEIPYVEMILCCEFTVLLIIIQVDLKLNNISAWQNSFCKSPNKHYKCKINRPQNTVINIKVLFSVWFTARWFLQLQYFFNIGSSPVVVSLLTFVK